MFEKGLPERFQQPEGWLWRHFENARGHTVRYGAVIPPNPVAIVVGLQGLGEFGEKYFETARTLLDRNIGFVMMDWTGQGKSHRYLSDPFKRHATSFNHYVDDIHDLVENHVKPMVKDGNGHDIPLLMIGHSMGGHIGLRVLHDYPGLFAAAAFSAPMVDIKATASIPQRVRQNLTRLLKTLFGQLYVGFTDATNSIPKNEIHSQDPVRQNIHKYWCEQDESLRIGDVTYGWVHAATDSADTLQRRDYAAAIETPCLLALAGQETLVDNQAARQLAQAMPQATVLELQNARHEILMECDPYRDAFFDAFFQLAADNGIQPGLPAP